MTAILNPNTPTLNALLLTALISTAPKVPSPFKKSDELPGKLNLFNAIAADGDMSLVVIDEFIISSDEIELGLICPELTLPESSIISLFTLVSDILPTCYFLTFFVVLL